MPSNTVKISAASLDKLRRISKQTGASIRWLVDKAIEEYLARRKK